MGDDLDAKIAAAIAAASQPISHVHKHHSHRRSTHGSSSKKKSSGVESSSDASSAIEETTVEIATSSTKEEPGKVETVIGQSEQVPLAEEETKAPSPPAPGGNMADITDFLKQMDEDDEGLGEEDDDIMTAPAGQDDDDIMTAPAGQDDDDIMTAPVEEVESSAKWSKYNSDQSPPQSTRLKRGTSSKKSGQRKRSESQGAEAVNMLKATRVQSSSFRDDSTENDSVPISKLESERISYSSTFRHRHVSPTKKSQAASLVNASGVDESKWDYMVETHEDNTKFQSWMEERAEEDREMETIGIYSGDLRRKKSRFDSTNDPRSKLLHASISRHLAQNLKAQIGALPDTKPWSLLTKAMATEAESKLAGPKKMAESMTIAIRIRPPTGEEIKKNFARVVTSVTVDHDAPSSSTSSSLKDMAEQKVILMSPQMINEISVDTLCRAVVNDPNKTFPRDIASVYRFDHCYWSPLKNVVMPRMNEKGHIFATQEDLFSDLGQPVVSNAMQGISSCFFVYGPKSTGKSYSMFGDMNGKANQFGILPRTYGDIVARVAEKHGQDTKCQISLLEVYNEKVVDLLAFTHKDYNHHTLKSDHTRTLKIREHPVLGPYADGMRKVRVSKRGEVISLLKTVLDRRANEESWMPRRDFAARRKNATLLCTMEIVPDVISKQSQMDPYDPNQAHSIRVHMVDLASGGANVESVDTWRTSILTGSTPSNIARKNPLRVADVSMSGNLHRNNRLEMDVIKESACAPDAKTNMAMLAYNEKRDHQSAHKSQSHLNYILHCLERGFDMRSLPFRDSVLTWLLRVALTSPNSKVTMLASISPAEDAHEETLHTLKYSERLWSARRLRRFGHLSPTRPQRSGAQIDLTASRDDETIVTTTTMGEKSDILDSNQNNSLSLSRFRRHDDRIHSISSSRSVTLESRPEWQKYLKQSPPRAAKLARASRGRQSTRHASVGPGGLRSSSASSTRLRMSSSGRTDREADVDMQQELDMVRAERDAVLQQLEKMSPSQAPVDVGTPEKKVADLTQRLLETETELRAFKSMKVGLDRSEDAVKDGNDKMDRLLDAVKSIGDSLRGGDPEAENASLKKQLAQALDAASTATNDLAKLQKQTKEEFSDLWTAVKQLKQLDVNKDAAVEALVAERNNLRASLSKSQQHSKSLEGEIKMLDNALLSAVGTDVPPSAGNASFTPLDTNPTPTPTPPVEAAAGPEEFAHSVAQSPFTPEGDAQVRRGTTSSKSGKSGKKSAKKDSVTRPFSTSVPSGDGGDSRPSLASAPSNSAEEVTDSVDETLQALGRFLVHDTNALSMQQGRISGRSPQPTKK